MSTTTLTVVIPTHNRLDTLKQTLYHLENGSVIPDEVIVVDDGSDVPIEPSINKDDFGYPLNIIRHDRCRMQAAARNTGIRAAHKDILLLLDDDIFADHDMIKYHKFLHEKHPEPEYAIMGRVVFDPELVRTPLFHYLEEYGIYRWLGRLAEGEFYSAGTVTTNLSMKLDFIKDKSLFDENFPCYGNEDTEFSLRLMESGLKVFFHHSPSGRHHRQQMDIEDFFRAIRNGGYSKAYWAGKRPDDTNYCVLFESLLKKYFCRGTFEKICKEFESSLGSKFLEADISQISAAEFAEFRAFLEISESWNVALGIITGWNAMIPGFTEMAEDIRHGLDCKNRKSALVYFRNGFARNPDFFPAALLLAEKLQKAKKLSEAKQVLAPFSNYIWAKLRLGEIDYHLEKYEESLAQFLDVYGKTGHGKAIEGEQRIIAGRWLLKLLPKCDFNNEWGRRLWNDVSETDMIWNPGWVNGLESEISRNMESFQSFEERFPKYSKLKTLRKQAEILNQLYIQNYPLSDTEKYDYLLQNQQPIKLRLAKGVNKFVKKLFRIPK